VDLAGALLPLLPGPAAGGVIVALVGAGGKTSALFGLAGDLAGRGRAVLMTTTTQILDPRQEPGRGFDRVDLVPALAGPAEHASDQVPGVRPERPGQRVVLACEALPLGKLRGIHPTRVAGLREAWPFVLVEADGSRGLPVKAPGDHEPVVPAQADLVLGLIGLDCLGRPMDAASVHRPERFGPVAGCAAGEAIRPEHLLALVRSRSGLFRGAPPGARRALLLNKADRCGLAPAALLDLFGAGGCADLVLICSLADPAPGERVLAQARSQGYSEVPGDAPRCSGADRT
jgi:probable selenium-dependent hydroxylase accessory protein YqeC